MLQPQNGAHARTFAVFNKIADLGRRCQGFPRFAGAEPTVTQVLAQENCVDVSVRFSRSSISARAVATTRRLWLHRQNLIGRVNRMPIRAAWLRKRFPFRIGRGSSGTPRSRSHGIRRARSAERGAQSAERGARSSIRPAHCSPHSALTALPLVLVRSAYTSSAIYQQFFVP